MIEALFEGLVSLLTVPVMWKMLVGMAAGFWVGLLPGLGGATTLALMIPFTYGMKPVEGFAFLLGMYSVCSTTGDITSVLFGVPGETSSAATILDGHPMAKKGEAGRALGAALMSSLVGATIGAFALAASIPIIRPLVLALGAPELFMLAFLGLVFIVTLSGDSVIKGFASGFFGFWASTVGMATVSPVQRYTLGWTYFFDGLEMVPVFVGLFGIPEIVDLAVRPLGIAGQISAGKLSEAWQGIKDTFIYWGITVRCSIIGTLVGMVPGLGGAVAQWVAYGHAIQSSKDKSQFGKGDVRGVLAPGAANNSKEGGHLIPTVAFGIPGSGTMAILLGAFLVLGLEPGEKMLTTHLYVTFSMVWVMVISNIICVGFCLLILDQFAKITLIRSSIIIPFLMLLVVIGAFAESNDINAIVLLLFFGLLGYFMVLYGYPRPPLCLGFVLGGIIERSLLISVQRYGMRWLGFPGVIIIFLCILLALFYPVIRNRRARRQGAGDGERHEGKI